LLEVVFGVWSEFLKLKAELKKLLLDILDERVKLLIIVMFLLEILNIENE